jgi:hypothetical protein
MSSIASILRLDETEEVVVPVNLNEFEEEQEDNEEEDGEVEEGGEGEDEEEEDEEENTVRFQMQALGGTNVKRKPFESMLVGTCWLAYIRRSRFTGRGPGQNKDKDTASCRALYERAETEEERKERELAGTDLEKMRVWPNWVKMARFAAGSLWELERKKLGPSVAIRKKFPKATCRDLPALCKELLDIAHRNGLHKETVQNFKQWISKQI